jgi:DNA polymerase-3 subunit epsilon
MVTGKPKIKEVLEPLLEVIGDHIIIGHGIEFDIQLVARAAERSSHPCKILNNASLDTLRMARLYGGSPVNSLEQLRKHFNIPAEGAHRAMNDVLVNMEVFKHLARNFRMTRDIFDALSKPILFKLMPLGKHKGRFLRDVPLDYLLWAARQEFDNDLLFSLRTEINRRKKGNQFEQLGNPFAAL